MRLLFIVFLLLVHFYSFAQQQPFSISGKVLSDTSEPLESATVYLESAKDSALITYTITNREGDFSLMGKTYETDVNLYISYVGFATHYESIQITEEIELPTIKMKTDANALDEVVIKSRAPITVKKDTLEFNVASFQTKKDATVEDLLKELPGVEVDDDGSILVNGKPVNKILVNGKPFFGDDPTIATRNLTKEMIEKVQVVDTKTDAEAFAGEEGDQDNKTINLTIDEEKNKGNFGRLAAGGGTDERYEYAGLFNRFDNDMRLSVLFGGNNTNSPGFSFGEIRKMFGGGRSMMMSSTGAFRIDGMSFGLGEGIVTSRNGGANYADAYGDNTDISVDYFYSGSDSYNETKTNRETVLPETNFFTTSQRRSDVDNDSHMANLKFDVEVDSTFLINIRPTFQYSAMQRNNSENESSSSATGDLINESSSRNYAESNATNFKNNIDVTKKFGARGRFLKLTLTNEWNDNTADSYLNSDVQIFGDNPTTESRNQYTDKDEKFTSFYSAITYRVPLVKDIFFADLSYSYRSDKRTNIESTFDYDAAVQDYAIFNPLFSTDFIFKNERNTPGIGFYFKKEKWSISVDGGYVFRTMENIDKLRPELQLKRKFEALEASSYFRYDLGMGKQLYAGYSLSNSPPQLSQLQPLQNVTNPLFITIGNPDLKPTNTHSMYTGFNSFNMQSKQNLYFYANISMVNDKVVSNSTINENLIQTTTYENVSGDINGNVSIGMRKTITLDSIHSMRYRLGSFVGINKNINFFENEEYTSHNNSVGPSVGLEYRWKSVLEIKPNYRFSYNRSRYDIDFFDNQEFISHHFNIQTATFLPKKVEWRNDINFSYNPNVLSGFQKSSWFWNTTVSYAILQDSATLSLKVFDVLNQNTNAQRSATQNYIQDTQSLVLQRYAMLSFSWKFNSLGKKGEVRDGFDFF